MKRNNIFMWAYITFIILSSLVRLVNAYPLWNYIILAITVSGAFFAVEDLFLSLSKSLDDSIDILMPFIEQVQDKYTKKLEVIAEMEGKIDTLRKDESDDMNNIIKMIYSNKQDVLKEKGQLQLIINQVEHQNKKSKKHKSRAYIFAYCGFFCLLSIMLLSSFYTIPLVVQELLTVLPFAVILITKQISIHAEDVIKEKSATCEKILQNHEEIIQKLSEMDQELCKLSEIIENIIELENDTDE